MEDASAVETAEGLANELLGDHKGHIVELGRLRHAVTVYSVELIAFVVSAPEVYACDEAWKSLADIDTYPMPNPQAKLWAKHKQVLMSGRLPVSQPALER
jgi:adenine-specific DNA glycosylase